MKSNCVAQKRRIHLRFPLDRRRYGCTRNRNAGRLIKRSGAATWFKHLIDRVYQTQCSRIRIHQNSSQLMGRGKAPSHLRLRNNLPGIGETRIRCVPAGYRPAGSTGAWGIPLIKAVHLIRTKQAAVGRSRTFFFAMARSGNDAAWVGPITDFWRSFAAEAAIITQWPISVNSSVILTHFMLNVDMLRPKSDYSPRAPNSPRRNNP